ncbi:GLPGLI family protein [Chryseobacterium sp. MYb328]|uniref:GLPGLI family protein n=1 Tax=Chryseobacterium sp. MYb328 TaxID=2745231 RepID=UPI0030A89133
MKKNNITKICILLIISIQSYYAQETKFITEGIIEYERSNNMYALIQRGITNDDVVSNMRFEEYKKTFPQFKRTKSTLQFSEKKSLFTPIKNDSASDIFFENNPAVNQINTTYTDYDNHKQITEKQVFEDRFLIQDSIQSVKWKITDEFREIAGFNCRRANGLIMDSIYVVAFYTDQIPVSGGPESFNGLPGMILGVALPHENVTWFAKKINDIRIEPGKLTPPNKGKIINRKDLKQTVTDIFKSFGSSFQSSSWPFEL